MFYPQNNPQLTHKINKPDPKIIPLTVVKFLAR